MRNPGASHVICGLDAAGIAFDGVDRALRVEGSVLRLFGTPESFVRRRMGVALTRADDVTEARRRAAAVAAAVGPCPAAS